MGWFWGSTPKASTDNAYSQLDPKLKDFLDQESASKPSSQASNPSGQQRSDSSAPTTYRSQLGLDVPGLNQENQNATPRPSTPSVPPESLYQDGRYAHLWQTYRPQAEMEAASRSDQDKMAAVVDAYKDRQAAIGRAAVENCVLEQMAEKECYRSGDVKRLATMCRAENRAFNRCYTMQSRFLKALGYLSSSSTSSEEMEERIQMHADKLYHEMLAREEKVEDARKAGEEAPVFAPLIQRESASKALGEDSAWARTRQKAETEGLPTTFSAYSAEKQGEIRERIKGLEGVERELELQLFVAEERASSEYSKQIQERLAEEKRHRAERRERGRETVGDSIKRMWGWDRK